MRLTWFLRALAPIGVAVGAVVVITTSPAAAALEATTCYDATLARDRTEIDTDLAVQQFDATLGTLLEVLVTGPSIHLDTDAVFENTAHSAVVFAEHMDYQVTITSPGGLPSPTPIAGTIQRVPSQTLTAFDGTLDFLGSSAATEPSESRDESAAPTSSTDAAVLAAFTGAATVPFHLASAISETFTGGGGNVQAQINTFVAGAVQVCYRYALPAPPPPASGPAPEVEVLAAVATPSTPLPPATPTTQPRTLPATGRAAAPLTVVGVIAIVTGLVLASRFRAPRARLDG